jgi:hypothetical protein
VLLVDGSEASVKELADMLSAEVADRGFGTWELRTRDLWDLVSFLQPMEGIAEVRPVLHSAAPEETGAASDAPALYGGLPGVAGSPLAAFVGVYAGEHGALILDASGGFWFNNWGHAAGCMEAAHMELGQFAYADGVIELRGSGSGSTRLVVSGSELRGPHGMVMKALADGEP